jgi:hypothetical protein
MWYYLVMSVVVKTVKIPKPLASALARAARARRCSESELIREGIARVIGVDDGIDMLAAVGEDLGIGHGPRDLSSNRKHRSSYGRSRDR